VDGFGRVLPGAVNAQDVALADGGPEAKGRVVLVLERRQPDLGLRRDGMWRIRKRRF
jgi:hypothetical protein